MIYLAISLIGFLILQCWNLLAIGRRSDERIAEIMRSLREERASENFLSVVWN